MTTADFVAGIFWPLVLLFVAMLKWVRDPVVRRWTARIMAATGALYFVLGIVYWASSLLVIVDVYSAAAVGGIALAWFAWRMLQAPLRDLTEKLKFYGIGLVGLFLALSFGSILMMDLALPRTVLKGRVESVQVVDSRLPVYFAEIAGQTVRAPVYERLKFLPVVRVEVGRGTGYILRIEYLAN
jgi:hypothetical protein